MTNFEKIIKLFHDYQVEVIIVGGVAATIHGSSLPTQDIDFWFPFTKQNCSSLLLALQNTHPKHRETGKPLKESAQSLVSYKNLYLQTDLGSIDLLGQLTGLSDFETISKGCLTMTLYNCPIKVLDLACLIETKKALHRPKDKESIIQLEAILEMEHNALK